MTRIETFAFSLLSFCSFNAVSFAECPAPMTGTDKIAVRYVPSKNWSQFATFVQGHLAFLSSQMKAGNIQFAGPLAAESGDLAGGLVIYNFNDFGQVKKIATQDPLIVNKVVTPDFKSWMECSVAKDP